MTFLWDSVEKILMMFSALAPGGAPTEPVVRPGPVRSGPCILLNPEFVTVPGTLQSVMGCPADWQTECFATFLELDAEDEIWRGTFALPAGDYEI